MGEAEFRAFVGRRKGIWGQLPALHVHLSGRPCKMPRRSTIRQRLGRADQHCPSVGTDEAFAQRHCPPQRRCSAISFRTGSGSLPVPKAPCGSILDGAILDTHFPQEYPSHLQTHRAYLTLPHKQVLQQVENSILEMLQECGVWFTRANRAIDWQLWGAQAVRRFDIVLST